MSSDVIWLNCGYMCPPSLTDKAPALYQAKVQLSLCDPLGIFVDSLHRGNVVLICQAVSLSTAQTEMMAYRLMALHAAPPLQP